MSIATAVRLNFGLTAIALASICLTANAADSKLCASCHADIYRRYMTTPMAATSGIAGAATPSESLARASFATPGGDAKYEVSRIAGGLEFAFSTGDVHGRRSLDLFIGSGVIGRSYITNIDGFLFQAPVSYYSKPAAWSLSPGYERGGGINLTREVEPGCLNCHATGLQPLAGTSNGYSKPPFREAGVGCERCHGPGEEHLTLMKSGRKSGSAEIVNPATLSGQRRESVCAQCHLPGAVEIAKSGHRAYRPGDLFSDSISVFVWTDATRETTVNGHFEQLARSACKQASGDKLWCGTCHDPHGPVSEAGKAAYYRGKCLTCHTTASCKAVPRLRANAADRCATCHMPRASAATVQHAALTDHAIPRTPRPELPLRIAPDAQLIPFESFSAGDRELGLAYATVAMRDSNRIWGMRAFDLLQKVNGIAPEDAKVASALAVLYDRTGDEQQACKLYAEVVASGETASAAAVNYGTCVAKEGKLDEAMRLWSGVSQRNPGNEPARLNLAVAQFRSGKVDEARANLNEALRFNPVSKRARELLREFLREMSRN